MIRRPVGGDVSALRLRPYQPSATALLFHADNSFCRAIRGPFGSGKSSICCLEILSRALEQKPHNGVRRSRWLAMRNSYPELVLTTLKTWTSWLPTSVAPVRESVPMQSHLVCALQDGTSVDLEVIFMSFDHPDDAGKVKSLELTGAWLNEASELDEEALIAVSARVGRYPSEDEGGPSWHGIIMDTNSMSDDSWYYRLAEVDKPKGYVWFTQPPSLIKVSASENRGLSPLDSRSLTQYVPNEGSPGMLPAENIEHLTGGFQYYLNLVAGKSDDWISVYCLNQYGSTRSGKVIYPEYQDVLHNSTRTLSPSPGLVMYVGFDFGLNVSCVFAQLTMRGQLRVLREIGGENIGIQRFIREFFKPCLTQYYPSYNLVLTGDPAGNQRSQTTEQTCFQMMSEEGFSCTAAATNDFAARRESVAWFLQHLSTDGSAFLLDPSCQMLRKGFLRAYAYRKMLGNASSQYALRPDKNQFSHLQDALQYLCLYLRTGGYAIEKQTVRLPHQMSGFQEIPVTASSSPMWV